MNGKLLLTSGSAERPEDEGETVSVFDPCSCHDQKLLVHLKCIKTL